MKEIKRIIRLKNNIILVFVLFFPLTFVFSGDLPQEGETLATSASLHRLTEYNIQEYSETLDYDMWYFIYGEFVQNDQVEWSFSGSNTYVGIIAMAMDENNYWDFEDGYSYDYYPLSNGDFYGDSGTFVIPYDDMWYFVFWNNDPDQQSTYITIVIEIFPVETTPITTTPTTPTLATASFFSFDYETYDKNNDGNDDSVWAVFDPDLSAEITDTVSVVAGLVREEDDEIVNDIINTYSVTGDAEEEIYIDMGTVDTEGYYHIVGLIYYSSSDEYDDSATTTNFYLYAGKPKEIATETKEMTITETTPTDGKEDPMDNFVRIGGILGSVGGAVVGIALGLPRVLRRIRYNKAMKAYENGEGSVEEIAQRFNLRARKFERILREHGYIK